MSMRMAVTVAMVTWVACAPAGAETYRTVAMMNGVPTTVELRLDEGDAVLRYRAAAGKGAWETIALNGPASVLPLLADTRLEPLWQPIEAWAGPDLSTLRDAAIARARAGWLAGDADARAANSSEASARSRTRALLQYAQALAEAGRIPEAIALLREQRGAAPVKYGWAQHEWVLMTARLGTLTALGGDKDAAIAILREAAISVGATPLSATIKANLAAVLADAGQYREALALADDLRATVAPVRGATLVPGVALQFDMIRACALYGLGREAEARALTERMDAAPEPARGRYLPPRNRDVQERAFLCMRDPAALGALWARDLTAPALGSMTFVVTQPDARSWYYDQSLYDAARRGLTATGPMRVLPPRYAAALRDWR